MRPIANENILRNPLVGATQRYNSLAMLFGKRSKREEFEKQAEHVYPSIYGTALRLTRSRDDAEDLAQEAIIRAYEAFDRFDGQNFKAWILRITTNLYINRYRSQQRAPQLASMEEEYVAEPMSSELEEPDRLVFDEMLGAEVEEALAQVPEDFRLAVILSDLEGMSYQEIADATGVPVGTVRSRLARGRAALRKHLLAYAKKEGYVKENF
jgi:RNA polymerase sigma-70 factor (ECF subfamily)